jgi:hypothetical protein
MNKWDSIKWFQKKECACKCGCGTSFKMDYPLLISVDWLRDVMGVRFIVTSGFRCVKNNQSVGGSENSFHLTGKAIDVTVKDKSLLPVIFNIAVISKKFTEVGIKENSFIHLATGRKNFPYYYTYLKKGTKQLNPAELNTIQSKTLREYIIKT